MPSTLVSRLTALLQQLKGGDLTSLRSRVIHGAGLLILADLYANGVRLAANLVMTRLLYPEAFGLMLIVSLVFGGLAMLSDLGIRAAMIVKKGGIEDTYLFTAWTMGILRGILLAIVALLLAYPVSQFYGEPQLRGLITIMSLTPILQSLSSPYPILAEKSVLFGRVVIWNAFSQTLSIMILLCWLLIYPTIWALAANAVIASLIGAISSYYFFPGKRMRLAWDKDSVWQIFSIGRWIFIASTMTFLAQQGDSLIISKWVTAQQLGVFTIAITFAKLVETLVARISHSLLFPVYSELQSGLRERFDAQLRKIKFALYGLCSPLILAFALFGRDIINVLYDARYHEAGWILEIMAAGSAFVAAGAAILSIPLSFGDSYRHMWLQVFRFTVLVAVMTLGGYLAGITGLVIGIAVAQMLFYPILRGVTHKYGIRDYQPDLVFIVGITSLIALVWYVRGWPLPA